MGIAKNFIPIPKKQASIFEDLEDDYLFYKINSNIIEEAKCNPKSWR